MKIMVTGATGFIGNTLIQKLCNDNNIIHVLCRNTSDISRLKHPCIKIFKGDILDKSSLEETMHGCETVYHLAAYARNWAKDPGIYFKYNVHSLKNIFDCAIKLKIKRVLVTSSCVVFGPSNGSSVNENSLRSIPPFTEYESSKIEAEKLFEEYLAAGLDIVNVYPTRVFGPGKLTENNGVTMMIDLYLRGKMRFVLGNGDASGNYSFVNDIADGMVNTMKYGKTGERYILGGENLSFNKLFSLVAEKSGKKYRMFNVSESLVLLFSNLEEYRAKIFNHYPLITPGWVKTFCFDWNFSSNKAVNEINYKITPFEKALETTLSWLSSLERRI